MKCRNCDKPNAGPVCDFCGAMTPVMRQDVIDALLPALKDVLRIAAAASAGVTGNTPRLQRARDAIKLAEDFANECALAENIARENYRNAQYGIKPL